jgi:chromosomal replication initiation ATPase DnaA
MQRKPQPAGDLPAHVTDTITVCKSLLEAEYDLATYNTYLRDVQCAAYDEATHTYTLTTSRTTSHDMLEQRLHTKIERTLSTVAGHPVTVTWQRWQDAITDTKQPAAIA